VEGRVRRLVHLRNREARRLGYRDYYALSLTLQELDEARLFALLDDLKAKTDPLWDRYKGQLDEQLAARFGVPVAALRPWHYPDPFFQEAPPARRTSTATSRAATSKR
jgi:peptidyl-dipeptidase A